MPTEHLSGSTATLPPANSNEDLIEFEEVKFHLAAKEQVIQNLQSQLREAVYLQQQSKYEIIDKEQKIQDLQDTITELHNEMAIKDSENLNQLQDIHHLESKVKALKQELWRSEESFTQLKKDLEEVRLGPNSGLKDTYLGCSHTTVQENQTQSFRATSLLKTELERRDGTILNLRKEVLLLQEKRDGLTTELDVQERRIYHLQAELREGEAKLEQKQSCLQQLKEELDTTKKLHKDAQEQAEETKLQLEGVQAELKTMKTKYNLAINEV
ncbi:golgin subfamily A member 3-like [Rhincodon typus]|uniref:golgin subfamily A member 3-like n=1 Tax=Rhincodon typus TaxID=259920 RepID=UPI00202FB5DA|nr:golgin subfamily A member 3-like [Rhincodon typus]